MVNEQKNVPNPIASFAKKIRAAFLLTLLVLFGLVAAAFVLPVIRRDAPEWMYWILAALALLTLLVQAVLLSRRPPPVPDSELLRRPMVGPVSVPSAPVPAPPPNAPAASRTQGQAET